MRIFKETQRFTQPWLIALIGVSTLVPFFIILKEYLNDNSDLSTQEFLIVCLIIIASASIIFIFKLATRIDEHGIHYKFFPFHRSFRLIPWHDIKSANLRTYDPITEYGGWGYRPSWKRKHGKAINVSGTLGIQLILKNGKKILIGTQQKNAALSVLETYKHKYNRDE